MCDLSKLNGIERSNGNGRRGVKNFSEWGKKLLGDEGKKLLRNNREIHWNENKINRKFDWVRVGLVNKMELMVSKTQVQ